MIEYWFHSFDINPEAKHTPNGKRLYLNDYYEKRELIDEEGHWKIISRSLTQLLTTVDEQISKFTGYTHAIPLVSFTEMPMYGDLGWEIQLDVGSWGEI